jgi:hypothetical protein
MSSKAEEKAHDTSQDHPSGEDDGNDEVGSPSSWHYAA